MTVARAAGTTTLAALAMVGCAANGPAPSYDTQRDAAYRATAFGAFQELVSDWVHAVNTDDQAWLSTLHTPDASVTLHRTGLGRQQYEPVLAEWLDEVRSVLTGPADFDFSGSLAYGVVRAVITPAAGGARQSGRVLFVIRQVGGGWQIRSVLLGY